MLSPAEFTNLPWCCLKRMMRRKVDVERKLTAILCADVHGYSRLMGEDEEATLCMLSAHRKIIDGLIEQHHGRFVNSAGDSVLAEFASVVNAVQGAVEIQAALKSENASVPPERRMEFRIGVNLGDVMVEGEQIYGDGVNVAARLESLAEPGGICISGTVHEQVRDKLALSYDDAGEQEVKNIARPVRVWRVLVEPGTGARLSTRTQRVPRKYVRRGIFSIAGLAIIVATIVLVQHLSLRPPTITASIPPHFSRSDSARIQQTIEFCRTADGVRIAYATTGTGPPVIMLMGWFTNLESGFLSPLYTGSIIEELSARHFLVRYDGRGFGLSDRGIRDYSLEARLRDLDAVVAALRLDKFALFGISSGAQTAVAYAARHPAHITRMVLYGSIAKAAPMSPEQRASFAAFISVIRAGWGSDNAAFRQIFTNQLMP